MKQCPVCKTNYTDETLQFCLADGATLFNPSIASEPTQQFSAGTNPIRVNITQEETPTVVAKSSHASPQTTEPIKKSGSGLIIGFLVVLLLFVGLGSAGVIGWLLLKEKEPVVNNTQPSPPITNSITKSPTPDEAAILKEKLANLEKKVQEQKNKQPTVPTISNTSTPQSNKITARVNSPNDGFLALRTEPSAETGDRILQIPHGANVTVNGCLPKTAGKNGRWCRVDYNGNSGWAFDAYLIY